MSKTGCKYERKARDKKRIVCARDGAIRTPGVGCKGEFCVHYKPTLWRRILKHACKRCVYYESIGKGIGKCNHPRDFYDYMHYVRGNSTSCPFWDEIDHIK